MFPRRGQTELGMGHFGSKDLRVTSRKKLFGFFKIYLKIHFIASNSQICFTAKTAHAKFSLPPMRGLKLVCIREILRGSGYFNRTINCFKRLPGFEINFDQYSGIVVDYSKRNYKINSN